MNPTDKEYTFGSCKSLFTNKSLQNTKFFRPLRKNKKTFPLKKNKTLLTHNPTVKYGMTVLIEYYNGLSLDKNEGQLATLGMFYCRDSAKINRCSSRFKLHRGMTLTCSEIVNKNIPLSITAHAKRQHDNQNEQQNDRQNANASQN